MDITFIHFLFIFCLYIQIELTVNTIAEMVMNPINSPFIFDFVIAYLLLSIALGPLNKSQLGLRDK